MSLPTLVTAVDDLYRSAVTEPERWNEAAFADWSVAVAEAAPERARANARTLRRCLRAAVKLARFWSAPGPLAAEHDWPARVDLALGVPAWRPSLELALAELEVAPSAELYAHVAARFRVVTGQPFAGGASFEDWAESR